MEYAFKNPFSIVSYRVKEINITRALPYFTYVTKQGIEEGVFNVENPKEVCEILLVGGNGVMMSSNFSEREEKDREKTLKSMVDILVRSLNIEDELVIGRLCKALENNQDM